MDGWMDASRYTKQELDKPFEVVKEFCSVQYAVSRSLADGNQEYVLQENVETFDQEWWLW